LTRFHGTLPKNNNGFAMPISKLRENTLIPGSISKISKKLTVNLHYGK